MGEKRQAALKGSVAASEITGSAAAAGMKNEKLKINGVASASKKLKTRNGSGAQQRHQRKIK